MLLLHDDVNDGSELLDLVVLLLNENLVLLLYMTVNVMVNSHSGIIEGITAY